jgi:FkbM family methyltransferase
MVEANNDKEHILKKIGNYKIALLSSEADKEVNYYKSVSGDASGNSIYLENTNYKFIPERRITTTLKLIVPKDADYDLIKMDVQGSELDIIKGGLDIIKKSKLENCKIKYGGFSAKLIKNAKFVIGFNTTGIIESLIAQKKVLVPYFNLDSDDFKKKFILNDSNFSIKVLNVNEFKKIMITLLNNQFKKILLIQNKKHIQDLFI